MFDRLASCDETGVDRRAIAEFFNGLVAFRDDAIDRLARLALGSLAEDLEHLLEALI
jgi:hypothetical protein